MKWYIVLYVFPFLIVWNPSPVCENGLSIYCFSFSAPPYLHLLHFQLCGKQWSWQNCKREWIWNRHRCTKAWLVWQYLYVTGYTPISRAGETDPDNFQRLLHSIDFKRCPGGDFVVVGVGLSTEHRHCLLNINNLHCTSMMNVLEASESVWFY